VGWFADLCGGDTDRLGKLDPSRRSNYEHCRDIVLTADSLGYKNILLPTSYMLGQEVLPFAAAIASQIQQISLLTAIRTGEIHPPMLARHLSTLDHLLQGRLTVNIINSELPGLVEDAEYRYQRCKEVIQILQQAWTQEKIDHQGEIYRFSLPTYPVKPYQQHGGPLLYFGGISPGSRDVCAQYCDVFLMWPDTEEGLFESMQDLSNRAAAYGRSIDFGLRIHVIVRETEEEARFWAKTLISELDAARGVQLKSRTQDSRSVGVLKQDALRTVADEDDYIEGNLWMGIGRARSGCGAALVGNPSQILERLDRYLDMGIRAFIFSGYPLIEECQYFAKLVLPHLPNVRLAELQERLPTVQPVTPLTIGELR
jgi:alkanesulfonate monooxygenase